MNEVEVVRATALRGAAAVALSRGHYRFHAGIAFRSGSDNSLRVLHLAGHLKVRGSTEIDSWAGLESTFDPAELAVLAASCRRLMDVRPAVPFGLAAPDARFDDDGKYLPGPNETGLTCATFVQKVFEWSRIPLVDASTWEHREEDVEAQKDMVLYLTEVEADPTHIQLVANNINGIRVRPEEIAAASTAENRPIDFEWANTNAPAVGESAKKLLVADGHW